MTAARRYNRPSAPTANGSHLNSVKSLVDEVPHADVVVQDVDLLDVLPAVPPYKLVAVDVEPQPLGYCGANIVRFHKGKM